MSDLDAAADLADDRDWRNITTAQWVAIIPKRAARWAREREAIEQARLERLKADQARRAAEWPVERIRATMAATVVNR